MSKRYNYDWKVLVHEQLQSGLNMKQYCINKDIPYSAFKNHACSSRKKKCIDFLPVEQEKRKEITLKINDNELTVATDIDDLFLQRILKALAS